MSVDERWTGRCSGSTESEVAIGRDDTPPRPDRRVGKTRRALKEALTDLILEKGYEGVTVQDVIDRADVGRSTFYAHFIDKDDLLMAILADLDVPAPTRATGNRMTPRSAGRSSCSGTSARASGCSRRSPAARAARWPVARRRGGSRSSPKRSYRDSKRRGSSMPSSSRRSSASWSGRSSASWIGGCAKRTST